MKVDHGSITELLLFIIVYSQVSYYYLSEHNYKTTAVTSD